MHCLVSMMKYFDSISRYVDHLVYQCIITPSRLHSIDVVTRSFRYSLGVFICCNTPRRVTASYSLSIFITISSILSISTLYHTLIILSIVFNFSSIPLISYPDPDYCVLLFSVSLPSEITWLSFDSVINSLEPILLRQGCRTL